eukprot:COSAG02_NODE_3465_length_6695_cov_3.210734_10_plen_53_part_00
MSPLAKSDPTNLQRIIPALPKPTLNHAWHSFMSQTNTKFLGPLMIRYFRSLL